MSWIQLLDCSKLAINWKIKNDATICWHDFIVNSFWCCFVLLVNFSYWSKFYVNIVVGSGVMSIFFYEGLTRNLEIGNIPAWVCPISGDWGKIGIPNLTGTFLIKCYCTLQNARLTAFTVFELLRENQKGVKLTPPHTHTPRTGLSEVIKKGKIVTKNFFQ